MKVSCVIPVHNGERFLKEAIESVTEQDHADLEVVVADDASTDGTRSLVQELAKTDPRIRLLTLPKLGQYETRNRGLLEARGDIIGFLDADDLWSEDRLARELPHFEGDPGLDFVIADCLHFFDWLPTTPELVRRRTEADPRYARPAAAYTAAGLLARRRAFDIVGIFDAGRGSACGMDWFLRARDAGLKEEKLSHISYRRRLHGENYSLRISPQSYHQFARTLRDRARSKKKGRPPEGAGS